MSFDFENDGKAIYEEIKFFSVETNDFINSQPSAKNLDASEKFLRRLNAVHARHAEIAGKAESFFNALMYHAISTMSDEEFKKIKNSSTLTERYVIGKYPKAGAVYKEIERLGRVLQSTAENTRTLLSSYRLEREFDLKTRVRQRSS